MEDHFSPEQEVRMALCLAEEEAEIRAGIQLGIEACKPNEQRVDL